MVTTAAELRPIWTAVAGRGAAAGFAVLQLNGRPHAITGGDDGTVRVWDLDTQERVAELTGHTGWVWTIATTNVGGRPHAVTGGDDGTVRLWDLTRSEQAAELSGHAGWVWAVTTYVVQGHPYAVSAGRDDSMRVWDLVTKTQCGELAGHGRVRALTAIDLDSRPHLLSGGDDGTVRIWDLENLTETARLARHIGPVLALGVITLGGRLHGVSGSGDGTIRVWDLATARQTAELTGQTGRIWAVATLDLDGHPCTLASDEGTVRLWDLGTNTQIAELTGHTGPVRGLTTLTDHEGPLALSVGDDGTLRVWDLKTKSQRAQIAGHASPVAVLATLGADGHEYAVTGSEDGCVRTWDLRARTQTAELIGHSGQVTAAGVTRLGDRPFAVTGGGLDSDGRLLIWDIESKVRSAELNAHPGRVRALDTLTHDEHSCAITVGGRSVRVWDLDTKRQISEMRGQTGLVRTVASITIKGRSHVLAGGDDGVVRLWDLVTGQQLTEFPAHAGMVRAVAALTMDDAPHAVTVGNDGVVRIWNLATYARAGELAGHRGPVRAVVAINLDDRPHAITGGDDGTVRVWDLTLREEILPFAAHRGAVTGLSVQLAPADRRLISVGEDGHLKVWSLDQLLELHSVGADEMFVGENTGVADRLTRSGLAAHLVQRLQQLSAGERSPAGTSGDLTGSGIIHVEGRWGAGKTTFVELALRTGWSTLTAPVVVRYDAWRQASIAPEWWSLASETRRAVHRSRSFPTRVVMTILGFLRRLGQSTSTWVALLSVAGLLVAGRVLLLTPGTLPQQIDTVVKLLTGVVGALAVIFVITRSLFWAAPVLGRLHMRTDDNPLGEISGIVGHLRRWSPRQGVPQRLADWLLAGWLLLCVPMAVWWPEVAEPGRRLLDAWGRSPEDLKNLALRGALASVVLAAGVVVARIGLGRRDARGAPRKNTEVPVPSERASSGQRRGLRRRAVVVSIVAMLAIAAGWLASPLLNVGLDWVRQQRAGDQVRLAWGAAAVLGIAAYIVFLSVVRDRPRRMVLLVVDDLDRCDAERVVRLLETIHTLMRGRVAPHHLKRWRNPAPLGVVVLGNGAWIRAAFRSQYSSLDTEASEDAVHDSGADFLQKIFDHSVLVPNLSPRQTQDLIHLVARSRYQGLAPRPPGELDESSGRRAPEVNGRSGSTPDSHADQPGSADRTVGLTRQQAQSAVVARDVTRSSDRHDADPGAARPTDPASSPGEAAAISSAQADLGAYAQLLVTHLLTNYAEILPGNPRLIIRIATAWAMLRAVAVSLGRPVADEHHSDLLVRAAVIWIRFPVLVDEILDSDSPPIIDPGNPACSPRWRRRDVQQVLTTFDGELIDITALAAHYGRFFSPPVRQ